MNIVAEHFDRNRTHRLESRLGVKTARDVEEEEKQAYAAKQFDFYQQKQKMLGSTFCLFCFYRRRIFVSFFTIIEKKMILH
jgi:hypothetical protein